MLRTAGSSQGRRHPPRGAWGSTGRTRTRHGHFLPPRPDWQPRSWAHKMEPSSLPSTFLLLKRFEGTRLLDASPLPLVCAPATIHSPHNPHLLKTRVPLQSECFFSSRPPAHPSPSSSPTPQYAPNSPAGKNRFHILLRGSIVLGLGRSASAYLGPRGLPTATPALSLPLGFQERLVPAGE